MNLYELNVMLHIKPETIIYFIEKNYEINTYEGGEVENDKIHLDRIVKAYELIKTNVIICQ